MLAGYRTMRGSIIIEGVSIVGVARYIRTKMKMMI